MSGVVEGGRESVAKAMFEAGAAALARGEAAPAVAAFRALARLAPEASAVRQNLAAALLAAGEPEQAAAAAREGLALAPEDPGLLTVLGDALAWLGARAQSIEAYRSALARDPGRRPTRNNLALSLLGAGKAEEALALVRDLPDAAAALGQCLQALGRHGEAAQAFARRLDDEGARALRLHSLRAICDWSAAQALEAEVLADAEAALAQRRTPAVPPFALIGGAASPELQRRVAAAHARFAARGAAPLPHRRRRAGRLTVAYVSPDFRAHSVGRSVADVLAAHDRDGFRWLGYLASGAPDEVTAALRPAFDGFIDLSRLAPDEAARRIHADGVDVLVDLAGHTRGAALNILARRPAPVQAHWLGYGLPLGADYVPWLITDAAQAGDGAAFAEALVRLPDSFVAAARPAIAAAPARAAAGLPEDAVVFACFNAHYKIDPESFACWMRLLRRLPGSRLWLLAGEAEGNLRKAAAAAGVAPERLVFAPFAPHAEHLARHRLADLALDPFRHCGGVTTTDALWAGLPVLTRAGAAPAERTGASILAAAGFPELIARSTADYEELAVRLAAGPRPRIDHSAPLFDATRLARNLERAYRLMWERWARGEPPADLTL